MHQTAQMALYGLVAGASPLVLVATLVVLGSGRGRINGVVFTVAFVLAQTGTYLAGYALGAAFAPSESSGGLMAAFELTVAVLLLAFGWRGRGRDRDEPAPGPERRPRTEAVFTRLATVTPVTSFGVGVPLGVGAKRLLVTLLAAATAASSGLSRSETVGLSVLYVALATVLVWVPVVLYLVFGSIGDRAIAATKRWVTANERELMIWLAFVLGALLAADALLALV